MVQWLRLHAPNAGDMSSIPGYGTKIPYASQLGQKKEKKKSSNLWLPVAESWGEGELFEGSRKVQIYSYKY